MAGTAAPASLDYPRTNHDPSPLVDLTSKAQREALSAPAVRGFFNLASQWTLRDQDAMALLGGLGNGTFYRWKRAAPAEIDADKLARISYLVGIYKALHILYGEALADEWVRLPNSNRIFGGKTPLEYMTTGGQTAMQTVRRLLDARRGGA